MIFGVSLSKIYLSIGQTFYMVALSLVFGLLIAFMNKFAKEKPKKKDFGCEGCPQAEACGKTGCSEKTQEVAAND